MAVSSFSICSLESYLENPRKLNEQILNKDIEFIPGEDSQVIPFLSLVSIVSPLSFLFEDAGEDVHTNKSIFLDMRNFALE